MRMYSKNCGKKFYQTDDGWVEFFTAVFAIHSHCTASLVGNFATRPVILNISVKVL